MYGKMNILFYPKKSERNDDGMVMLYARITIKGKRSEFSLGRRVDEQRWDSRAGKLRGTSTEVSSFNRFLDNVRNRLYDI
ncbi:MAG: Arm DNA-binding domain-containing protein, partial [Bacteroidota bacterium]